MMPNRFAIRLYALVAALLTLTASPVLAQFQPPPLSDPTIGEQYLIEGFAGFWNPSAEISIASESLGIAGTTIDFKQDLGLQDQRFPELRLVLRLGRKHKLRLQSIPITYEQGPVTVTRDIVFNGQRYSVGVLVNSALEWKAYQFGYEYDFIVTNRGYGGFILEAKYTDVKATLDALDSTGSPLFTEFAHARAPIPALGGVVRVYPIPNISVTAEVTGIKLPNTISEDYEGHYADIDIYGILNFTPSVGTQIGWRSLDIGYLIHEDTGSFLVRGPYFGLVARY